MQGLRRKKKKDSPLLRKLMFNKQNLYKARELRLRRTWEGTLIDSNCNFKNWISRGLHFKTRLLLEGASGPCIIRTFPRQRNKMNHSNI